MRSPSFFTIVIIACFVLIGGCRKDETFDAVAQFNKEIAAIDAYVDANHPDAIKDERGIRMVITELGSGLPAQLLNIVDISYKGYLFSNGNVFDEGTYKTQLVQSIIGWQFAFTILPVGSKATIYIPSALAYGKNGSGSKIPGNSTIVFDVTFNSVTPTPVYKDQFDADRAAIESYLTSKSITTIADPVGVNYVITREGTGEAPGWYKPIKMTYSFRLLTNDAVVLATYDREPNETNQGRPVDYIPGVGYVLSKMKPGGKATVYIPSGIGFGINPFRDRDTGLVVVPANTNIIVDIELKEVL